MVKTLNWYGLGNYSKSFTIKLYIILPLIIFPRYKYSSLLRQKHRLFLNKLSASSFTYFDRFTSFLASDRN